MGGRRDHTGREGGVSSDTREKAWRITTKTAVKPSEEGREQVVRAEARAESALDLSGRKYKKVTEVHEGGCITGPQSKERAQWNWRSCRCHHDC